MSTTTLIYKQATEEILYAFPEGTDIDAVLATVGLDTTMVGQVIVDGGFSTRMAKDAFSITSGNAVPRVETLAEAQHKAFKRLKINYLALCEGVDPATGQRVYVDCMVGETTYRMDAGRKPAETHNAGIRLAIQTNETSTFVVDFNNEIHYSVPLPTAQAIALQQAIDARSQYVEYQLKKQQIAAARTVADVRAISLTFTVNTA